MKRPMFWVWLIYNISLKILRFKNFAISSSIIRKNVYVLSFSIENG